MLLPPRLKGHSNLVRGSGVAYGSHRDSALFPQRVHFSFCESARNGLLAVARLLTARPCCFGGPMEAKPFVPAAEYVRMSTEDQQYSIANQQAAIRTYAKSHGYVVVSTYADAGKSGIEIKHRKELVRLL